MKLTNNRLHLVVMIIIPSNFLPIPRRPSHRHQNGQSYTIEKPYKRPSIYPPSLSECVASPVVDNLTINCLSIIIVSLHN